MGGKKQIAIAVAACRLHNFCISQRMQRGQSSSEVDPSNGLDIAEQVVQGVRTAEDVLVGGADGASDSIPIPRGLLDGGAHFDDIATGDNHLPYSEKSAPRLRLCEIVQEKGLRRKVISRR